MLRILPFIAPAALLILITGAQASDDAIPIGSGGCDHTFDRAGHPQVISKCATPSNTCAYTGYYVGGGCVLRGGPPGPTQGTWGWDYIGPSWLPHKVILGWCQNCRPQGGTGSYKTDGPHVPDPFSIKLPPREPAHEDCGTCHKER